MGFTENNYLSLCICYANALTVVIIVIVTLSINEPACEALCAIPNIRHFHKDTKLAIMAVMPTLFYHVFIISFIIWNK